MKRLVRTVAMTAIRQFTPRLAYRHVFIEDGYRHSMIHVQNPFSFFRPNGADIALAIVTLFDEDGHRLVSSKHEIPQFGTLALDVRNASKGIGIPQLGTVTVDLRPPFAYRHHLNAQHDGLSRIASPFWMRFFDDRGSHAYVHSIEADRSRLRGVPWPASQMLLKEVPGGTWQSDRTLTLHRGESATAFCVNHSRRHLVTECRWTGIDGEVLSRHRIVVPPSGVRAISTPDGTVGTIYLSLSQLSTPNAKPYVLVETSSGQFGLTHG